MNCKNTLDSKTHSFNLGQILFTILALLVIVSFTSLSYAEYPSPLKQIQAGVAPEDIMCNTSYVHVIRDNGNHACLTEKTAEKVVERFGWKIIEQKSEPVKITDDTSLEQNSEQSQIADDISLEMILPPTTTYVEHLVITNTEVEDKAFSGLGPGHNWPKFEMTFPGTAQVGVPFDVTYDYAYLVPDEDTGRYTHPEIQCTDWTCEQQKFRIGASDYVDIIKEGKVFLNDHTDIWHLPLRNFTNFEYTPVYDNTKPLQEKFTFVVNEPYENYRMGIISISLSERHDGEIHFYVDETGKIFFDKNLKQERFSSEQFASKFSEQTKDVDSFVTKVEAEVNKLHRTPVKTTVVEGKSDPNGPPREVWPIYKDFLLEYWPSDNYEELFRSHNYTETFIRSFLSEYPELKPQSFDFISKFILPSVYATQTNTLVTGQLSNTDYDNGTSFVHGATVCAYDRTYITTIEPISLNGVNVCSETTESGTFTLNVPIADPNGYGNTDLVLVAEPQNQHIIIKENNNGDIPFLEDDLTTTLTADSTQSGYI